MGRLYCVPDIHGRLDLLEKLLSILYLKHNLNLTEEKLIFMGDMIDRGPNSKGVLDKIRELQALHPNNVIVLGGNHEWLAIDATLQKSYDAEYFWHVNGGLSTLESFKPLTKIPDDYIKWMASLPFSHQEPGFFFSHAPVPRENRRNIANRGNAFTKDELTWTYDHDEFGVARNHGNGIVGYCGHIHALNKGITAPRFYDHYVYCDSGCGCSDKAPLVAVECGTKNVIYARPDEKK